MILLLACAPPGPPNILVVSMDTVRFDRTSLAPGSARDTTPNLAALATEGVSWSEAYAVGNESLYSHAAIFTGLYPSEIAIPDYASFALPKNGAPTLAGVLSAYGYATAAFTGGGHIVATFGFDRGFGTFSAAGGDNRFGSLFEAVPPALAWIRAQGDRPWFAFVHGYDAHSPYTQRGPFLHPWGTGGATPRIEALLADPLAVEQLRGGHGGEARWYPDRTPADFTHAAGRDILGTDFYALPAAPIEGERVETLTDAEVAHIRDHYDSGVAYADAWLGVLLGDIDLDETLVIVLSDHGEDLLDHGFMNHRAGLWDSTLHVPLVVAGPGFPPGPARTGLVDLRSVLATVLRAAGATLPGGVSAPALQDAPAAPMVYAEGVMGTVSARGPEARYADGLYVADRLVPSDARVEPLRAGIAGWRAGLHPATEPGAAIPEAIRDALRERGYWTPEP